MMTTTHSPEARKIQIAGERPVEPALAEALVELEGKIKEKGLTQRYAAQKLGISEERLSKALHGNSSWNGQEKVAVRIKNWITRPDEIWALEKYLEENNISPNLAAKHIGISPTAINGLLDGTYFRVASGKQVLPKVKDYLWALEARTNEKKKHISFIETSISSAIFKVCHIARAERKKIALIVIDAGVGKTTAFKRYIWENPGTSYILGYSGMRKSDIIYVLAKYFRTPRTSTFRTMFAALCEEVKKNPDRLLIIDQANKLSYEALDILQDLKEATGIGMILAGTKNLMRTLKKGEHDEYEQIWSRLRPIVQISGVTEQDAGKYVRAFFPQMNGQLTEDKMKLLFSGASRHGRCTMRDLENLLEECELLMKRNNCQMDKAIIEKAITNLAREETIDL